MPSLEINFSRNSGTPLDRNFRMNLHSDDEHFHFAYGLGREAEERKKAGQPIEHGVSILPQISFCALTNCKCRYCLFCGYELLVLYPIFRIGQVALQLLD
jgi:hypothetical protein